MDSKVARALLVGPRSGALSRFERVLAEHGLRVTWGDLTDAAYQEADAFEIVFADVSSNTVALEEWFAGLERFSRGAPVVGVVPQGRVDWAFAAMRSGASDGVVADAPEGEILGCLRRNLDDVLWTNVQLRDPGLDTFLVGVSEAMSTARSALSRAARRGAPAILITGPLGVGKTRAARFVHAHFPRTDFVHISCAGSDETTLREVLFGSAGLTRPERLDGAWVRARGGFLCLEDVGRLPLSLQQDLAAAFEHEEAEGRPRALQTRVMATAVNANPALAPRLFHRFTAAHVHLPGLSSRRVDIRPTAEHILADLGRRLHRPQLTLTRDAWSHLEEAGWVGNVRQLQSTLERALLSTSGSEIDVDHLDTEITSDVPAGGVVLPPEGLDLAELERDLLLQALRRSGGNRTRAGALLGINRDQVRYRIDKFSIDLE
ncbi:MAG: sigma 54-interacting transcriptional regulator [Myxococcota bacterium]